MMPKSLRSRWHIRVKNALVIGDDRCDVWRIISTLRMVVGYNCTIRSAASAKAAVAELMAFSPDVVIMDDVLSPDDTAITVMPLLRWAGYLGLIMVASRLTHATRTEALCKAGAGVVIRKDDLDSVALFEALVGFRLAEEGSG